MSETGPEPRSEFERLTEGLEIATKEQAMARLLNSYKALDQLAHAIEGNEHTEDEWIEVAQAQSAYGKPVVTTVEYGGPQRMEIRQRIGRSSLGFKVEGENLRCSPYGQNLAAEGIEFPLEAQDDTRTLLYMAFVVEELKTLLNNDEADVAFL